MEQLRILAIGDPHFKIDNAAKSTIMANALVNEAQRLQPDIIVNLGDTLDRHASIHVDPLCAAIDLTYRLTLIAPVYMLIGNHDRRNNSDFLSEIHPFTAIKRFAHNVTVVDTTTVATVKGYKLVFVPYVPAGRLQEALDRVVWRDASVIFAHQEMRGVCMHTHTSTTGDVWPQDYPLNVFGHIHMYQQLAPNLISVGSPMQHSAAETEEKSISFLTLTAPRDYTHERIYINVPRDILLCVDADQIDNLEVPLEGNIRIKIRATPLQAKVVMKSATVRMWRARGIHVCTDTISMRLPTQQLYAEARTYKEALYSAVSSANDALLTALYEELLSN